MFCPTCGASQNEELKFCKFCGANLYAVRQEVDGRGTSQKIDWSKTWVADMFLSEGERKLREAQLEFQCGITPEVKHLNEIKAGVITTSGRCRSDNLPFRLDARHNSQWRSYFRRSRDSEPVWVAGLIPLMVGIGLIINGVFISNRLLTIAKDTSPLRRETIAQGSEPPSLRSTDTNEFASPQFGIAEGTTRHLELSGGQRKSDDV